MKNRSNNRSQKRSNMRDPRGAEKVRTSQATTVFEKSWWGLRLGVKNTFELELQFKVSSMQNTFEMEFQIKIGSRGGRRRGTARS